MLFTLCCCFSTGLAVYCILKRVHRAASRSRSASRCARSRRNTKRATTRMIAQLNAKEGELVKARGLVELHEAVPTMARPAPRGGQAGTPGRRPGRRRAARQVPERKLKQDPLNVFEMSRPFTDTSYDALLATSDVVKIEPAGG